MVSFRFLRTQTSFKPSAAHISRQKQEEHTIKKRKRRVGEKTHAQKKKHTEKTKLRMTRADRQLEQGEGGVRQVDRRPSYSLRGPRYNQLTRNNKPIEYKHARIRHLSCIRIQNYACMPPPSSLNLLFRRSTSACVRARA